MQEPVTLEKKLKYSESMDFGKLMREGLDLAQQLSGKIWTDFNAHDPGYTILEQLVYALTDLGYRTSFDVGDLLFFGEDRPENIARENALFDAQTILTTGPVTVEDYRKMFIDRIPEISNIWFEPRKKPAGTYDIFIQTRRNLFENRKGKVAEKVRKLYMRNRNLCEDIGTVTVLKEYPVGIEAEIEVGSWVNVEMLLAKLLFELEDFLNPGVEFHTLDDLSRKEAFDGPKPVHGFIRSRDLHEKSALINIPALEQKLLSQEDIRSLRKFEVLLDQYERAKDKVVKVPSDSFSALDVDLTLSRIKVYSEGVRYPVDIGATKRSFRLMKAQKQKAFEIRRVFEKNDKFKTKNLDGLQRYDSIQNLFPQIYGVGPEGVPGKASADRKSRAAQLKAYLYFFEQLMANHLAQLANLKHFFSLNENLKKTYFTQLPESIPDLDVVLKSGLKEISRKVEDTANPEESFYDRRNRALDHLLARFGEDSRTFSSVLYKDKPETAIRRKSELLKIYPELSKYRSRAYNYGLEPTGKHNVPDFKRKVCLLLDLDPEYRTLHAFEKEDVVREHLLRIPGFDHIPNSFGDNSVTIVSERPDFLRRLFRSAVLKKNFKLLRDGEESQPSLHLVLGDEITQVASSDSLDDLRDLKRKLIKNFEGLNRFCDGFHVIEHILLRPSHMDQYHFRLYDDRGEVFLVSPVADSLDAQRARVFELLRKGVSMDCFVTNQEAIDEWELLIVDPLSHARLGKASGSYLTEAEAMAEATDISEYLKSIQLTEALALSKFEFVRLQNVAKEVSSDFYESRISVAYPNWTRRFQDTEFERLFRSIILKHMPAYITVDFFPLSLRNMTRLEATLEPWLEYKKQTEKDPFKMDELSFQLIELLREFQIYYRELEKENRTD
ncbi:hypothetical protein FUAX_24540 [Fulvitalea axinellae]|uniref:Uncharacterized protein n=1 Tax=Fulvitalea axinellae TaxID=1182444 RepID=A0AAU9CSS0_9BACT|nr:hypothetical protein FUAX_24540 [Fulvitalea axinellae]